MENYDIKDVSTWKFFSQSKGSKEKRDLIYPKSSTKVMFKEPAEGSGDNWSEKIASELGKVLGFNVQNVDLAVNNGIKGVLIYYSVQEEKNESLTEGAILLKKENPEFKVDDYKNYYFQIIRECLLNIDPELLIDFIEIIIFDILIGNTDRHCENWGIIRTLNSKKIKLVAAYDNSSSLGREYHSNIAKVEALLKDDKNIEKYILKGKSMIRWEDKQKIKHFDFLEKIAVEYKEEFIKYIPILETLNDKMINQIVNKIPEEFMGDKQKKLVKKIIKLRKVKIIDFLKSVDI